MPRALALSNHLTFAIWETLSWTKGVGRGRRRAFRAGGTALPRPEKREEPKWAAERRQCRERAEEAAGGAWRPGSRVLRVAMGKPRDGCKARAWRAQAGAAEVQVALGEEEDGDLQPDGVTSDPCAIPRLSPASPSQLPDTPLQQVPTASPRG